MITPMCSKCGKVIPTEDVNAVNDLAYCRGCNLAFKLSGLIHGVELSAVDIDRPPPGTFHRSDGIRTMISASHRSPAMAIVMLLIALFWNGILSIFVALAIASTLVLFDAQPPGWMPKPIMNGKAMGTGITIFLWLFLTPFLLIGFAMFAAFLSALGGRTEVQISPSGGVIFSGIGSLGFRKRFDSNIVTDVRVEDRRWRDSDGDRRRDAKIIIETQDGKRTEFGSSLTDERRRFVAAALRKSLRR